MDQMCQIIKCSQYVDELSWIKCVRLSSVHSMLMSYHGSNVSDYQVFTVC